MNWLRQSTAVTLKLGPFLDSTDGDTEETGLSIAYTDVMLSKNGGTIAAKSDTTGATHDTNGWYSVPLNTTDTGTLGRLKVYIHVSGALAVWGEYLIVPANVYDSLVLGTDYLQGDAIQIEGSDATDQINAACDTAISDASLATAANLQTVDNNVDSVLADTNELQTNQGNWLTATGFSTHSAADVWSVATRTLTSFGTLISNIWANATRTLTAGTKDSEIDAILTDTGTTIPNQISALNNISAAQVNTECDQAIADAALATAAAVAALNNLSQADVRTAIGMAAANLDTQIDGLSTFDAATDEVEANIKKVNDITVNGSGTEADPWGPA